MNGTENNGWYLGTWKNSSVGLYRQYAAVQCASRIVITWPEETLCIAMESDETTQALALHLTEMIAGARKE